MAAGLRPMKLEGGERLPRAQDPRIYNLMCPYVRAVFNKAAADAFPPLEAVVFTNGCDALRRLLDLWRTYLPTRSVSTLHVPKIQTDEAVSYFAYELRRWARDLEAELSCEIKDEDLHGAIVLMNRLRKAFQEFTAVRKGRPESMSFEEVNRLTARVLGSEPNEGLALLEEGHKVLSQDLSHTKSDDPRVFLMSTMLDQPRIIRMIEEAGLVIISEDSCTGARHFEGLVSESGDPYHALAKRYLRKWPCARMKGTAERLEWIEKEIEDHAPAGLIFLWLKYCDQSGFEIPLLKPFLENKGLPLLVLENDYTERGLGQIRVRIEAFAEMLKDDF